MCFGGVEVDEAYIDFGDSKSNFIFATHKEVPGTEEVRGIIDFMREYLVNRM